MRRNLLILLCLLCLPLASQARTPIGRINFTFFPASGPDRFATYFPRSLYLEAGIGAGIWYQSDQVNMEGQQLPLMAFLEISKDLSPLSYGISYNTYSTYQQREFFFAPEYASLYARYSVSKLFDFVPPEIDVYAMAGLAGWRAELRDERDPQFQSSQPVQFDAGMGWMAGAGVRYYYRNLGIGAQWQYFNAQGEYIITDEDGAVTVETGSAQVQITLSYRFRLGDPIKCPTFR
ncbi:MAG: outer membrane protein [Cyclobacteriaceae bacterium]